MTLRLDALYDTIVELEERIEDAKLRKSSIEMETITLDNIYKLMLNFGKLYDIISDEEKKSLITYLIKEIQIYPNGESEQPLKSIEFNFPIYRDGQEVRRLLLEKVIPLNRDIVWTTQFKKDYKLALKRHMDIALLDDIIRILSRGEPLPEKNRDHALTGDWVGHRECHILPDWLLVYRIENDVLVLTLARTGTHSDLFGK